ncbi:MAG: glycosyltransferase [Pseudomonadota bacterium]
MTDLPVSVVVVSRGRPEALKRCLLGLEQLQYSAFEIIVVADPGGIAATQSLPFAGALKLVGFEQANISAARNLGIAEAAGEVVAFIDDDAVPEPQWLRHLIAPAAQSEVAAMGGYVRGRNGISFQWRARSLDAGGEAHDMDLQGHAPRVLHPPEGRAIKTEGTNMAVRRDVLVELGGFDEAFHYFLDETDLNMRLARAGYATALVPLAEVHHGFAANPTRSAHRVPKSLFDIGASWAVFQRKHVAPDAQGAQWKRLHAEQRRRVLRHMVAGGLEPRDVRHLLAGLEAGYAQGRDRTPAPARLPSHTASAFSLFPSIPRASSYTSTTPLNAAAALQAAGEKVKNGEIVTVFALSTSAMYHQVGFTDAGVWLHKGGVFGRSDRDQPIVRAISRSRRINLEVSRVAVQRGLTKEQQK